MWVKIKPIIKFYCSLMIVILSFAFYYCSFDISGFSPTLVKQKINKFSELCTQMRRWCIFLCLTGSNNGVTEYVRQELRAMVGARQQQVRILPSGQVSTADFEALGLSFEMPNQGKHSFLVWFPQFNNLSYSRICHLK